MNRYSTALIANGGAFCPDARAPASIRRLAAAYQRQLLASQEIAMNATTGQILATIRIFLALVVGLLAGFWGLVILFSDFAPHWSYATGALYVLGGHLLAGILIGMLLPSRWWLSMGAAWGSILMGVMGLVAVLRPASAGTAPAASILGGLAFPALTLLGIPAVVASGGYVASRVVATWKRRSTSSPRT